MIEPRDQEAVRRELLQQIAELDRRAVELTRDLAPAQLAWTPPGGGWGIAQVFEHLCVSADAYLVAIRAALAHDIPASASARPVSWTPGFVGRLLARSMDSPRRLPTPGSWRPGPAPRPDPVEAFLQRQQELARLLERAAHVNWRSVRMHSPISRLIRLNLGDVFTVLVRHAARHLRQVERLRALPTFPPSAPVSAQPPASPA